MKNAETLTQAPSLAISIENDRHLAQSWREAFQCEGLQFIISPQHEAPMINKFLPSFTPADIARIRLIIVDQGFSYNKVMPILGEMREINPRVFILETSGIDDDICYFGNAKIANYPDRSIIQRIIQSYPSPELKLKKLEFFSSIARREAQKADPASEWRKFAEGRDHYDPDISFNYLYNNDDFPIICSQLDIEANYFLDTYRNADSEHRLEILHYCWNMISIANEENATQERNEFIARTKKLFL